MEEKKNGSGDRSGDKCVGILRFGDTTENKDDDKESIEEGSSGEEYDSEDCISDFAEGKRFKVDRDLAAQRAEREEGKEAEQ